MHRHRRHPVRETAWRPARTGVLLAALVLVPWLVVRWVGPPFPSAEAWRELWVHHRARTEVVVPIGEAVFLVMWTWFGVTVLSSLTARPLAVQPRREEELFAEDDAPVLEPVRSIRLDPVSAAWTFGDRTLGWSDEAGAVPLGEWQELPPPVDEEPVDEEPADARAITAPVQPEPEWDVLVTVMGLVAAVDRDGRAARFEKSKSLELLAWLAQHRERPTRGAARTALWDAAVRDSTFANVVSDLRRGLARLCPPPTGDEWVGRTLTDDLPLHPRVRTDVELLQARLAASRGCDDAVAAAVLRPGLELVTGMPFSGAGTTFTWADGEGHTSAVVLAITSAATELAERLLRLDDIDGVFWATGQGLKVLPGQEELIALRMQAHAARGDLAGVRLEWDQYERSIGADPWEHSAPSPKLASLRRSLLTAGG